MARIGITGIPGTGKTTVARILARKLNAELIEVNKVAERFQIDTYKDSKVIDLQKLEHALRMIIREKDDIVLEGHLLAEIKLPLDYVFVLRCHPSLLEIRLKKKEWGLDKIKTNIEAEMLDYSLIKSEENYERVYQIDTTGRKPEQVVDKIIEIISGRGKGEFVDWSQELFSRL